MLKKDSRERNSANNINVLRLNYRMYYFDNQRHNKPHIPEGFVLEGKLPKSKQKLVDAWIEIHQEDLMADWQLAISGDTLFKIEPLK